MFRDHERCYRIVSGRDPRFDGCFVTAVRTTGIYCRPSCPARTPKPTNVVFYPTAAAAQGAGFRACKRCRPDASPGSPEWNGRSDVVARAVRLIADGLVDRDGVPALARHLGYSDRHLHRMLVAELGAGALALARSQRAQNARTLIEMTAIPMVDVAFAAGFSSLRQFNETVRVVFDASPTELRRAAARRDRSRSTPAGRPDAPAAVTLTLRLAHRTPLASDALMGFLGLRCIDRVESSDASTYRRTLDLPSGHGVVALTPASDHVEAVLRLTDVSDLTAAVSRCRRLLDLDADPVAVDDRLRRDPALVALVTARPGLRSPGSVDGFEMAVRAILGQQVSVVASLRAAARLVARLGLPCPIPDASVDRLFPTPDAVAGLDPDSLPMPRVRARALVRLGADMAAGRLRLDPGADRAEARAALLDIPGVGRWTADYVAMRALGDPDVLAEGDLVVRQRAAGLGIATPDLAKRSLGWAPWRTTVVHHLWAAESERAA